MRINHELIWLMVLLFIWIIGPAFNPAGRGSDSTKSLVIVTPCQHMSFNIASSFGGSTALVEVSCFSLTGFWAKA